MRGKGGKAGGRNTAVIIIRKEEVTESAHHGGAWKVAYADFVTAMMAFFLLMWLLNATTEDQRKGLADYFSPNNLLSHASSGTGQPFGGHTVFDHGAMVSDRGAVQVIVGKRPVVDDPPDDDADTPLMEDRHGAAAEAGPAGELDTSSTGRAKKAPATPQTDQGQGASAQGALAQAATPTGVTSAGITSAAAASPAAQGATAQGVTAQGIMAGQANATPPSPPAAQGTAHTETQLAARVETASGTRAPTEADLRAERERQEKQSFEQAAAQLRAAVRDDPALATLSRQLAIDITPQGLRIQLLDEDRLPMFATGSSTPDERARLLLAKVAPVLMRLPEDIAVVGHTDAAPFAGNGKTNWELSTERANVTRRLLTDAGLSESRVSRVTGLADRDPLLPADPLAAANRRIAIIVLRGTTKPGQPPATSGGTLSAPSATSSAASSPTSPAAGRSIPSPAPRAAAPGVAPAAPSLAPAPSPPSAPSSASPAVAAPGQPHPAPAP